MSEVLYKELSYRIVGAAMEVHKILGPGYLEKVYQNALAHELNLREIKFEQFVPLPVKYKGVIIGNYEVDLLVEQKIVLELKAVSAWHSRHKAQVLNYLATTGLKLAILLNFGTKSLQSKRIANSR